MTNVTLAEYEVTSRRAFGEFLIGYFNGETHAIGSDPASAFPEVEVAFTVQQLPESLPKPVLQIIPDNPANNKGLEWAGKNAIHRQVDTLWRMTLFTNGSVAGADLDHAQIQDLLGKVLCGARADLAATGLKIVRVGTSVPLNMAGKCISQRLVTTRFVGSHGSN